MIRVSGYLVFDKCHNMDVQYQRSTQKTNSACLSSYYYFNHKNYNFLACDWFKKVLFSTNPLAKLLSDSLLLDSLVLDSLLSDSSIKATAH